MELQEGRRTVIMEVVGDAMDQRGVGSHVSPPFPSLCFSPYSSSYFSFSLFACQRQEVEQELMISG